MTIPIPMKELKAFLCCTLRIAKSKNDQASKKKKNPGLHTFISLFYISRKNCVRLNCFNSIPSYKKYTICCPKCIFKKEKEFTFHNYVRGDFVCTVHPLNLLSRGGKEAEEKKKKKERNSHKKRKRESHLLQLLFVYVNIRLSPLC